MTEVLLALMAAAEVLFLAAVLAGRVRVRRCCGIPPEKDLRILNALAEDERARRHGTGSS